jgi:hypothetical protein
MDLKCVYLSDMARKGGYAHVLAHTVSVTPHGL